MQDRSPAQVEQLLWEALIGWGVGSSREEIAALPAMTSRSGAWRTSWLDVVEEKLAAFHDAESLRPGELRPGVFVGAFLLDCFRHGFLTRCEELHSFWRDESRSRVVETNL
jgi:hypothetical protein